MALPLLASIGIQLAIDQVLNQKDSDELILQSYRILQEEMTQAGYDAAHFAMLLTPHGEPAAIEARLRAPATRVKNPHGRLPSVAEAIINARRGRRHKRGLTGPPMRAAEERMIARRKRGAYYLAAGWLEPLKILERAGAAPRDIPTEIVDFGPPDGDAIPPQIAGAREEMFVQIENHCWGAEPRAREAMEVGLARSFDLMINRLERRLEDLWERGAPPEPK